MHFQRAVLTVIGLTLATVCAQAAPITYTETGNVTGSIGGQGFTSSVIFTLVADTVGASAHGSNFGTATLYISSLNLTASPTDNQWQVFSNTTGGGYGGFFDNGVANGYLLDTLGSSMGNYDMVTDFGPFTAGGFVGGEGVSFSTSAGTLIISSLSGNSTFTAALGSQTGGGGSAPEPTTVALLGLGLFATGAFRRLRS